ncbi:hypothetical protein [Amycolatopsis sp. NPDC049868]|uniref:hypothetical protein n=1 Tax=Amycolatopsis sp. NPDC049868 TaxID=3363934 RepID=UPI00379E6E59
MSFEVDTEALGKFADLLERYHEDGKAVFDHFDQKATLSQPGLGILGFLGDAHEEARRMAGERTELLTRIAGNSVAAVRTAAKWYEDTDAEKAAKMDATYPAATPGKLDTKEEVESYGVQTHNVYTFQDIALPNHELSAHPDPAALRPQVNSIDDFVHLLGDLMSPTAYLRAIIKNTFGADPIDEAIQFFAGDWEQLATCEAVWFECMKSVGAMAENLHYSDEALAQVWKGNAADAAIGFFQKMWRANLAESDFFSYLYGKYRGYVEIAFNLQQVLNDLINLVLDYFSECAVGLVAMWQTGSVTGALAALLKGAVWGALGKIMMICTFAVDAFRLYEVVNAAIDLPDEAPVCEMEQLGSMFDPNAGYKHPES